MPIPIVVGVTGHRDLRERDIPYLRERVRGELQGLAAEYPSSPLVMLSSLAAGADLLCAEVAADMGVALKCPLPMPEEEYSRDFAAADLARHLAMLKRAEAVFVAPDAEPAPAEMSRDFHYRQAGIYVAEHSHVLLALWDGSPAQPEGCGTAEAVDFMLKGISGDGFRALNDGAVIHLPTPRKGSGAETPSAARLLENEPGSLRETLSVTDTFNRDAERAAPGAAPPGAQLLPELPERWEGSLKELHGLYQTADSLSLLLQKKYLRAIKWFSVFGVLLVAFFLFYDELESDLFLLCYGALVLVYMLAFVLVRRGGYHEKYLRYRMLSETLRAQFYLRAAGMSDNIGAAFTWTQKREATWVKAAVSALLIGGPASAAVPAAAVKAAWIDGQLAYHTGAFKRDSRRHRRSEAAAGAMLMCSLALFAAAVILELLLSSAAARQVLPGPLPAFFMQHPGQEITLRGLLKIALGGVSAAAVFLSNYYGKLSLQRKSADHEKMALLYASAKEQYEAGRAPVEQLFRALAREEIIENGSWFSYCRENPPSFNV